MIKSDSHPVNHSVPSPVAKTPLYHAGVEMKARFTNFGGWEMPLQYTSIIEEHQAVRSGAGMFDISHMGKFTNIKLENANFSNADLRGVVFNGTLLIGANLHGVNFSDGISYLSNFRNSNLSDAIFTNAMMLRSTFDNVDVTGADFTNTILDRVEVKKMCANASGVNSQTGVDTRKSLGCR